MSRPAAAALAPLPFELVYDDGEPLETEWHSLQLPFLRTLIRQAMAERGWTDFYVGANIFVYYSQARSVGSIGQSPRSTLASEISITRIPVCSTTLR